MKLTADQIARLESLARQAGDEILRVYESDDFDVEAKGDGSPLTRADRMAHECIVAGLKELAPEIPIVSEESDEDEMNQRREWSQFWLVDPLDGTKEFIKRNGEFTVNIALIEDGKPTFGVVFAPVLKTIYAGGEQYGSWRLTADNGKESLSVNEYTVGAATVVASRSHRGEAVESFLEALTQQSEAPEVRSMGSSLKICLVASGEADVYPRLGPTSEWDTGAAHAVVLGAGGQVTNVCGQPLEYNKESILNPWFLVFGTGTCDWKMLVPPEPK
jgi:3'(2'), 5'-bisphosphate nucleotidase